MSTDLHPTASVEAEHRTGTRSSAPKRFVVVGTQRSGTTFIRQCLDSHPQVRCRGELFARSYGKADGYASYRHANVFHQLGHYLWRARQVRRFLGDRLTDVEVGVAVSGFKLMRSQVRRTPYWYPMVLDFMHEEHYHVLHVVRRNLLRVLVSRATARARGQYHARDEVPTVQVALDVTTLLRSLDKLADENAYWRTATRGLPVCVVEYEQFVDDRQVQSQRMLEFLGVDPEHPLHSPHQRVNRATLKETLSNFDDVAAVLAGTPFEAQLEG
ncbi:MAG: sulfotransferase [Pseudomonadota bacterium]